MVITESPGLTGISVTCVNVRHAQQGHESPGLTGISVTCVNVRHAQQGQCSYITSF
jgi:hypothetical protein